MMECNFVHHLGDVQEKPTLLFVAEKGSCLFDDEIPKVAVLVVVGHVAHVVLVSFRIYSIYMDHTGAAVHRTTHDYICNNPITQESNLLKLLHDGHLERKFLRGIFSLLEGHTRKFDSLHRHLPTLVPVSTSNHT